MSRPVNAIVLAAAGTNCDRETIHALELAGATARRVHVSRLAEAPRQLDQTHILVLPGGFTYGDDVAAGRILALELESRLGAAIRAFVDKGRLVIGICNGFQVLVKMGLLPDGSRANPARSISLVENDSGRFECRWVTLESRADSIYSPREIRLEMPVAHAEGKFVVKDPAVLERLAAANQVAFVYANPRNARAPAYPENPNGSAGAVAGITDASGRILGLMPHPERFVRFEQHPAWTRRPRTAGPDGRIVFDRAVAYARGSVL